MIKSLLSLTLLLTSLVAEAQTVKQAFLARAYQATERLEQLILKNGDSKGANLTPGERCEWKLENSYLAFGHKDLGKIVMKPAYTEILGKESMAYNFLLMDENENAGFMMNYVYGKQTDQFPTSTEIYFIKDGWSAKFIPAFENQVVVRAPDCTYWFNLQRPLEAKVEAN